MCLTPRTSKVPGALLDAVQRSLTRDRIVREKQRDAAELRQRYNALSIREREVMSFVVSGMLNKQVAAELGASEATVKNASEPSDEKDAG